MATQLQISMNRFRVASRELFNNFFRNDEPYSNEAGWDGESCFSEVQVSLFNQLVLVPFGFPFVRYGDVQEGISVILSELLDTSPAMINRDISSGYWDYPLEQIDKGAQLAFISFFDWDALDWKDNRYVRAIIKSWPAHPELKGKHLLIDWQYVTFDTSAKQPAPSSK